MLGSEIRNLILAKMDEYTPYGPDHGRTLLAGSGNLQEEKPIYEYIELHLEEAANEKLLEIPIHMLRYKTAAITPTPDSEDNRIGSFTLPSDFLRLHTLRMKSWPFPLHESVYPGHPVYNLQKLEWSRGNKCKPVAVVTGMGQAETGTDKVLNYYSVDASDTHEVLEFKYISTFKTTTDYADKVAEVIALNVARKICEVYGMTEQAATMNGEMNAVLDNMKL